MTTRLNTFYGLEMRDSLYMLCLPIGRDDDHTLFLRELIPKLDIIAAEDTRVLKNFLEKNKIKYNQIISYYDQNEDKVSDFLITQIKMGKKIGIAPDAGTPQICDPGYRIISKAFHEKIKIGIAPGASSLSSALALCPIGSPDHLFLGFAPSKTTERKNVFKESRDKNISKIIFFESSHRIIEHLENALEVFGNIPLFLAKDLTKSFQELFFDSIQNILNNFKSLTAIKGEFVLIYDTRLKQSQDLSQTIVEIEDLIKKEFTSSDILKEMLKKSDLKRNDLYDLIIKTKKNLE